MKSLLPRLRETTRAVWTRLRGGELSPERLAGSVSLGIFVGVLPLYGAHFALCAFFGLWLRLDVVVAYAAAHISIPPLIPFLLYGSLQIGAWLLTGSFRELSLSQIENEDFVATIEQVALGSFALALGLACVFGLLTLVLARLLRERSRTPRRSVSPALIAARRRVVARYAAVKPQHRHYVSSKLRLDPLTEELFALSASGLLRGRVLDAGSGRGQFSLFLAELGGISAISGFDHDEAKIEVARLASRGLSFPARFQAGDLCTQELPESEVILLLDVLHYLSLDEQDEVLRRAARALSTGGVLLLRETNVSQSAGARMAQRLERAARALGINRGARLVFRDPADYARLLESEGLRLNDAAPRGALDNLLWVAIKPRALARPAAPAPS